MLTKVAFPVRYAETDAQQVVYYANHLAWFELGNEALLAALGRPLGLNRPGVLEATCRYRAPIHYGETVVVQSTPLAAEDGHLRIAHTIRVGAETRAHGSTLLAGAGDLGGEPSSQDVPDGFAGWSELAPHGRREEFSLRVRYAETDANGGAHFSRYLVWFEVGRIAFLHRLGLDYARMESGGSPFVIAWSGCRYLSSVRFDDSLLLEVWVEEVGKRSFAAAYRIVHAEENRPVALGRTVQAFVSAAGRPAPIPEAARDLLLAAEVNRSPEVDTPIVLRRQQ